MANHNLVLPGTHLVLPGTHLLYHGGFVVWYGNPGRAGNRAFPTPTEVTIYPAAIQINEAQGVYILKKVYYLQPAEYSAKVLTGSDRNIFTLVTCVMNQLEYRWCIQAVESL